MTMDEVLLTWINNATPESAEQDQTAHMCTYVQADIALHSPWRESKIANRGKD